MSTLSLPHLRLAEPITTYPSGIPNMQLFDPRFAEASTMLHGYVEGCHRNKYGPTLLT